MSAQQKKMVFGIVGLLLLVTGLHPVVAAAKDTNLVFVSSCNLIPGDSSFETEISSLTGGGQVWNREYKIDTKEGWDGKCSLKLKGVIYSSKAISTEPGKTYTFSLYAKAEEDNLNAVLYLKSLKHTAKRCITLGKKWSRYSIKMEAKGENCWLGFGIRGTASAWVDAYQFEEGDKPSPYKNKEPICIGVHIPSKHNYVFFPGEDIDVNISVYKAWKEAEAKDLTLSYRITDFSKKVVKESEEKISLDKEGKFRKAFSFRPEKLGLFIVRAQLKKKGSLISEDLGTFAVVNSPVEIEKGMEPFCGIATWSAGPGLKRIGVHWVPVSTHWKYIEKIRGKYYFGLLDRAFSLKKQGYKIKFTFSHLRTSPEWSWDKEEAAELKRKKIKVSSGLLPSKEHLKDWREFVHKLAVRYKDVVDIWEIGAEDDLTTGRNPFYLQKYPEDVKHSFCVAKPLIDKYAEMIKIAAKEIKKVSPDAKIGAIRPSGADSNCCYTFSEAVFKRVGKEFNLFPLDPYCSPRFIGTDLSPVALPEDFLPKMFGQALKLGQRYGCNQHIYISELGWRLEVNEPSDSEYAKEQVKRLTRTYLVSRMTKGVDFCHWFNYCDWHFFKGYSSGLWRDGHYLLPTVPAYSVVAKVVENVIEPKEIDFGEAVKAVVFRKHNKADGAIWLVRGEGKVTVSANPASISIFNVMGNPVKTKVKGKEITFKIGELPVYLTMQGERSFENLDNVLSSAKLHLVPVKVFFITRKINEAVLCLQNQVNQDLTAEVSFSIGKQVLTKSVHLPKRKRTFIKFPLPEDILNRRGEIEVEVDCGKKFEKAATSFPLEFEKIKMVARPVKIDGDLSEWKKHPYILMNKRDQILPPDPWVNWNGPKDLSAKVYVGWDKHNFYLAGEVTDDKHFNNKAGRGIWNGDCLQFAFDPWVDGCLGKIMGGYGPDDCDLVIALAKEVPLSYQSHGSEKSLRQRSEFAVVRDEANKKTFYEVKIPFNYLHISPTQGTVFGFSFVIFDDDAGGGQTYYYQLSRGITGKKNPCFFRKFTLVK
ncbi:hypothetical protein KAW08_01810 [bacterium]|nr:hypothetical protein [bacterium]